MLDDRRWLNLNNPYGYRNDNLRALGFKSYHAYLKSDLWKGIRARVLDRAKGACERCRRPATQVHHRAYDPATLRGETIDALTAVCSRCHHKAEMQQKPQKVERGTDAYTRMERANTSLFHQPAKKKRRAVLRTVKAAKQAVESWSDQDDEAALAWMARR